MQGEEEMAKKDPQQEYIGQNRIGGKSYPAENSK